MAMVGKPIEGRHRLEQKVEEMTLREWFTRGSLVYLYVLTITFLGVALGGWIALRLGMPGFILLGVVISQVLMMVGTCAIVLYRRKPKEVS